MDNLTHSLVGALIGQAGLKRETGLAMPALIIGANIPDIDASCVLLGDMQHLALRRGITHGPIAWVLLPLALAGILYGWNKWQAKCGKRPETRLPVSFKWLFLLSLIGCLTHPALDWMNSYGVRLLEPFSHRWFYGDTLFIVDIWLWLGMGFATWFSLRREKRGGERRRPARIALVGVLAYIGVNLGISRVAAEQAYSSEPHPQVVIANPVMLTPWRRTILYVDQQPGWQQRPWSLFEGLGQSEHVWFIRPCALPHVRDVPERADLKAFLFWSRAPFGQVEPSTGGTIVSDARFAIQGTSLPFSVVLPDLPCEVLDETAPGG